MRALLVGLAALLVAGLGAAPLPDTPFWQDVAVRIRPTPEVAPAAPRKLCVDRENTVHVLTDRGLARVYGDTLALDRSYRPLAGRVPLDLARSPDGDLGLLYADGWLSNARDGSLGARFPAQAGQTLALLPGDTAVIGLAGGLRWVPPGGQPPRVVHDLFAGTPRMLGLDPHECLAWDPQGVARLAWPDGPLPLRRWTVPLAGVQAAALDGRGHLILAGSNGVHRLDPRTGTVLPQWPGKLPVSHLTAVFPVSGGCWFGSTRGAFFVADPESSAPGGPRYATPEAPGIAPPAVRYYAGRRWLRDDHVLDLAVDGDGQVWILTATGLNKIEFRRMTLADKADWFHRKIRSQNLRFGLTAERRMLVPGDPASSEMIDTDNDGGWTSYYLGGLAARYAVTRDPEIRRQAWQSFSALERLQKIHTHAGFPARTIERRGFKFSDVDRWRDAPDPGWEWKGHTSSDEIQAHAFAHAVMWELVATNDTERARLAASWVPVVDHLLRNNLYLVDVDGQPTLWGRWNPEYVNGFPPSIVDRRLNSAEIIAALQLAHRMTGRANYRARADELFERHGYLTNIVSPMSRIGPTTGHVFRGNDMGNEWNHSDDELAFFTYWVLVRFAFTDALRAKYLAAVADHWQFEKPERYPIWNFVHAACGGKDFDPAGALWTLRGVPLDATAWRVHNSHRGDLTRLPPNFMGRELRELLPPGERLMARINTQPFILDHGDDTTEFPGDEFLTGYWLGRFVGAIGAPGE